MAALSIEISMPRRNAEVNVAPYWSKRLSIAEGPTPCYVLGVFQDTSEDVAYPVMVCELNDGRVLTQAPETVRFVDIKEDVVRCVDNQEVTVL